MSASAKIAEDLAHELEVAELKAWDALSRYKFQMFGYWAAIWVHLNRIGGFKRPNPWAGLVANARQRGAQVHISVPDFEELRVRLVAA